jgi:hypothetical protein
VAIHQVTPWTRWPSGDSRPIAVLPFELAELSDRYGLKFQEGVDDLGRYCVAAIELARGLQAWISKHNDDSNPGTVVYVDANADVAKALPRLIKVLGITREALLWTAPVEVRSRTTARAS